MVSSCLFQTLDLLRCIPLSFVNIANCDNLLIDLAKFWGDSAAMPEPLEHIREASDVNGVVQSLGRVPLSGQETAAEHWFSLIYERAAMLAGALAAAGDLLPDEEDVEP